MSVHLHLYFCGWRDESRAWRAGAAAIEAGLADEVFYVGHRVTGLSDREQIGPGQAILRLGREPARPGSSRWERALGLPQWWLACRRLLKPDRVSLIVAHSLASLPLGVWLSKRWGTPLLYDAHELETERNGWSWPIRRLAKVIETRLIRACDHTIVVSDSIQGWYESAYPGLSVSTVRNVPIFSGRIGESSLRETLGLPSHAIVFVYCGVLGGSRGLPELVAAFDKLEPDRHLVLIGTGPLEESLRVQSQGMPNVHLHDRVPQSELITLLSGADIGVMVPSTKSLSYRFALPNKVFEYAAAGLAICVGTGPDLQRFADSYPGARTAELSVLSLRQMALSWTRKELDQLRPMIAEFQPPTWEAEKARLLAAYELVLNRANTR